MDNFRGSFWKYISCKKLKLGMHIPSSKKQELSGMEQDGDGEDQDGEHKEEQREAGEHEEEHWEAHKEK
jgi:hypothetical protein